MVEATQAPEAMMLEGGLQDTPSTIMSKHNGEEHLTNLLLTLQLLEHRTRGRERQQPSSHKDRGGMVEPSIARTTLHIQAKGTPEGKEVAKLRFQ
jgi:hypothetical protein